MSGQRHFADLFLAVLLPSFTPFSQRRPGVGLPTATKPIDATTADVVPTLARRWLVDRDHADQSQRWPNVVMLSG